MAIIPDHIIEEIRTKADIVEIVGKYVSLRPKGGRYWGRCPFHNEKTPSFTVTRDKNIYYCFGCQKGGDLFNFLMEIDKLTFVEAVKEAGRLCGIEVTTEAAKDPKEVSFRETLKELYERVTRSFHHILLNSPRGEAARAYLAGRNINLSSIEEFKLGYAPADRDWLYNFLLQKNYSHEFLARCGLFLTKYNRNIAYFTDRIIFPITNSRGETIAFGGRALGDRQPKYLNSPETFIYKKSNNLYGFHNALETIRKEKLFHLVEGYIDVLAMHQAGVKNCIAPLGTALTENQVKLLGRFAEKGKLIFDGDEAGEKATLKAIILLEQSELQSEVVVLPAKSDPADILQKDGQNTLNNLLKCSINSFEFLIQKALLKFDPETPEGKERVVTYLFDFLENVNSEVKRDGFLNQLADVLGVDYSSVRNDFLKRNKYPGKKEIVPTAVKINITDELFLMLAIAVNREFFIQLRKYILIDHFQDAAARELYIALEECFREDKKTLESLLEKVENSTLKKLVLEKNSSGEYSINAEKIIYDGIYRLKISNLSKRRKEISILLKKYEKSEPWKLKDLLVEKMVLDKEFEELKVIGNGGT